MIVDLRSNPGGMLTSVCDMLDDILPKGLLVYTEDRSGKRERIVCKIVGIEVADKITWQCKRRFYRRI